MTDIPLVIEPDPDDPGCATVQVDGAITGSWGWTPVRFVLDTGARRTQLVAGPADLADEKGRSGPSTGGGVFGGDTRSSNAAPSGPAQGRDGAPLRRGEQREQGRARIPVLYLGPLTVRDLDVDLIGSAGTGMRNLLGLDVLGRHCWHFRFSRAVLEADAVLPGEVMTQGALTLDGSGHPRIEVRFSSGPTVPAVWDSGAGITVVDSGFAERHGHLFSAAGEATGADASGTSRRTPVAMMAGPSVGGLPFAPSRVAEVDLASVDPGTWPPLEMILGYPLLAQADWYLDFPAGTWAITAMSA